MTRTQRALTATILSALTVAVFAYESPLVRTLSDAFLELADRWHFWHDAATVALAEPGALAALGVVTIAIGVGCRRRASASR